MTDLTAFLLARIAEDEAAARADHLFGCDGDHEGARCTCVEIKPRWRQHPARVLATCAAYKAIVERYQRLAEHGDSGDARWVLPALASIWGDHPAYDTAWRLS